MVNAREIRRVGVGVGVEDLKRLKKTKSECYGYD